MQFTECCIAELRQTEWYAEPDGHSYHYALRSHRGNNTAVAGSTKFRQKPLKLYSKSAFQEIFCTKNKPETAPTDVVTLCIS